MLMPCVLTYVVPPPSPEAQRNQTAASINAATALRLAALEAAVMVNAPDVGRGRAAERPPCPFREGLLDHRQTDGVEVLEVAGRAGRVAGEHQRRAVPPGAGLHDTGVGVA